MAFLPQARHNRRSLALACIFSGVSFLAGSLTLLADTPQQLRSIPAGGCYCHCAQSRTRADCVMMCDLPKYLSRWWATSCAKPRMKAPADNHGAGPRYPHPDRAEHAKL